MLRTHWPLYFPMTFVDGFLYGLQKIVSSLSRQLSQHRVTLCDSDVLCNASL